MARKTKKEAQRELRRIRSKLGTALRRADGVVAPLREGLEKGYRWEPDEVASALTAAANLADSARSLEVDLREIVDRYRQQFNTNELRWLVGPPRKRGEGAAGGLVKGAQFLDAIDRDAIAKLEAAWIEGKDPQPPHEIYFLRRFAGAMRVLRMSWNRMFYAAQRPTISRMQLTAAQTRAYHNVLSPGVREKVHEEADDKAERGEQYVEVYDADAELVYVASPVARTALIANASGDLNAQDIATFTRLWEMVY